MYDTSIAFRFRHATEFIFDLFGGKSHVWSQRGHQVAKNFTNFPRQKKTSKARKLPQSRRGGLHESFQIAGFSVCWSQNV